MLQDLTHFVSHEDVTLLNHLLPQGRSSWAYDTKFDAWRLWPESSTATRILYSIPGARREISPLYNRLPAQYNYEHDDDQPDSPRPKPIVVKRAKRARTDSQEKPQESRFPHSDQGTYMLDPLQVSISPTHTTKAFIWTLNQ